MALLWFDGFDSYTTIDDFINARYGNSADCTIAAGEGRFGKNAVAGTSRLSKILIGSTVTELWTGRAVKGIIRWGETPLIKFYSSSGVEVYLSVTILGSIVAYNGAATPVKLGETSPAIFRMDVYNWLEIRFKFGDASTGEIEVWLNDKRVLNLSGIDTNYYNTASGINAISLGSLEGWNTFPGSYVDDVYILDTTGISPWNTRIGDNLIESLIPNSDAIPNNGTPSSGSLHYSMVDELAGYNTSDYITLQNTSTQTELFGHTTFSNPVVNIYGMSVTSTVKKSNPGVATYKNIIKTNNGTTYKGSTAIPGTSYSTNCDVWVQNPTNSQQWTETDINSTKFGIEIQ